MKRLPAPWLNRLNEIVRGVRRRQGWDDVHAVVQPPRGPDQPPLLRVEKGGAGLTTPLDPRALEQALRTGQEGPLIVEIKQAFLRVVKTAQRKEQIRARPARKKSFF